MKWFPRTDMFFPSKYRFKAINESLFERESSKQLSETCIGIRNNLGATKHGTKQLIEEMKQNILKL